MATVETVDLAVVAVEAAADAVDTDQASQGNNRGIKTAMYENWNFEQAGKL